MTLGTIIVTYNSAAWIEKAVRSLFDSEGGFKHRLVVIDNGSQDPTLEFLRKLQTEFTFDIVENQNTGFAAGVNLGLRFFGFHDRHPGAVAPVNAHALPEAVLLLNPDAQLATPALEVLTTRLQGDVGIVAPQMVFPNGKAQASNFGRFPNTLTQIVKRLRVHKVLPWGHYFNPKTVPADFFTKERSVAWVSGGAMLIRRDVIERVGFWDENYFLYVEDVDFCRRARLKGFDIRFVPAALVYHKLGHSTNVGKITNDELRVTNSGLVRLGRKLVNRVLLMFLGRKVAKHWEAESLQYYFRKYRGSKKRLYYRATDLHLEPAGLRRLDFIVETLKNKYGRLEGLKILDAGAGHGSIAGALAYLGAKVMAVEKDPGALAVLNQRAQHWGFKVIKSDLAKFTTRAKFDVVVATEILEHFKNPSALVIKLRAALRPQGIMIFSVPNGAGIEERLRRFGLKSGLGRQIKRRFLRRVRQQSQIQSSAASSHQVFYSFKQWQKLWQKSGLSVTREAAQSIGFKSFFYVLGRLVIRRNQPLFRRLDRLDSFLASHWPARGGDGFIFALKSKARL